MQLKRGYRLWWILLPVITVDRICKRIALMYLAPHGAATAVPGLLSWTYTENRGAAFGMLSGQAILLPMTLLLIIALLLWLLRRPDARRLTRIGIWLIIGGGLGNLWDRIAYGFVVDFIRLDFVNFAIFNFADVCICIGAAIITLDILLEERKKQHA